MSSSTSSLVFKVLTVSSVLLGVASAVMEHHHNSYYPGGHSTSYYQPYQMHTYGSKYYNTESYGGDQKYGGGDESKDSGAAYEPSYYNPVASYYHSYMPKYHGGHQDYYNKYNTQYMPYYGGAQMGGAGGHYDHPKHDDYHSGHHFDMHK